MSYRKFLLCAVSFLLGYKFLLMLMGNIVIGSPIFSLGILDVFMRNDAWWYDIIVRLGYPTLPPPEWVQTPFPFFPLYPMLLKPLYFLTGSFQISAFIFSCVGNVFLAHFIYKYFTVLGWKPAQILGFLVFYQLFPFHYFFQVFYTEQLFVTLFFALFFYVKKNAWPGIFICCFLLALCRPTGLLLCFSMFIWFLLEAKNYRHIFSKKILPQALAFIGAPLGILLLMTYLHFHCGDALAFRHAQQAWNFEWTWPWYSIEFTDSLENNFMNGWALFLLFLGLASVINKPLNERLLVGINMLFPLCSGHPNSYYRMFSVIFPVFRNVFTWIRKPWALILVCSIAIILNLCTFYIWLATGSPLGY